MRSSVHKVQAAVRKTLRKTLIVLIVLLATVGVTWCGARWALRREPAFYATAVAMSPATQRAAGDELERQVLRLHNDFNSKPTWDARFTAEQINGWLASDLPEKFPDLLPESVRSPRVDLTPGRILVACRYETDTLSAVVTLSLSVALADEPNTLAVRIDQARAGLIPLPLRDILEQVTAAAETADVSLRWAQQDGAPVAIVTLDDQLLTREGHQAGVDHIEVGDGVLVVAGSTRDPGGDGDSGSPRGRRSQTARGSSGSNTAAQR